MGSGSQLISLRPLNDEFGGEIWDPDTERRPLSLTNIGPEQEWDVIVVNDPGMINAMAVPGTFVATTGQFK